VDEKQGLFRGPNGFNDDLDINDQPSVGFMAQYQPCPDVVLAVSNWWGPETAGDTGDTLYFVQAQAIWEATPALSFEGEYLYGMTESPTGDMHWTGGLVLVNYDIDEQWRVFTRWSCLDDPDGFITGTIQRSQEVSTGFGLYLVPLVEIRGEIKHNFIANRGDTDSVGLHATFGF
jgi:hypothetical protein